MPTIAYFANIFPSAVEPYVMAEIQELRKRDVTVIACSALSPAANLSDDLQIAAAETLYLQPLQLRLMAGTLFLCVRKFTLLTAFFLRALRRRTPAEQPLRALLHTFLGVYYARLLNKYEVEHIHVHHGYFGAWIGMVAARVLDINYSMTLHGSDLLLHAAYLDIKLKHCQFCVTISDFNRRHILEHYAGIDSTKVAVARMGVDCDSASVRPAARKAADSPLVLLAVGRLHAVKDHAFLVRACRILKRLGIRFTCLIAGDGPERPRLERLIRDLGLADEVQLLGELPENRLRERYQMADLVVLTSRSEGIPLVLMEAMAHGKVVLAPDITGIPELVRNGATGFLYRAGSLEDFVKQVELIAGSGYALQPLRRAAREHVLQHFNREKNVKAFCDLLVSHLCNSQKLVAHCNSTTARTSYENPLLQ